MWTDFLTISLPDLVTLAERMGVPALVRILGWRISSLKTAVWLDVPRSGRSTDVAGLARAKMLSHRPRIEIRYRVDAPVNTRSDRPPGSPSPARSTPTCGLSNVATSNLSFCQERRQGGKRSQHTPTSLHGHSDVTAALSLARAGLAVLLGLARPAYLSRAHADEPEPHPVPRYPTPPDLAQASSAFFSHHAPSNGSAQPSSSYSARHPNSSTREEGGTVTVGTP